MVKVVQRLRKRLHELKRALLPKLAIRMGQGVIRLLLATCRVEITGLSNLLSAAEKGACVVMLWHDRLALIAPIAWRCASHLSYAALVSASRDGRLVTEVCESYPHCRVITVAHDGRHHALREMIQQLRQRAEVLLITPDGPRGPRHKVKAGIALAARLADTPVIPFTWSASRFWQLGSWDKMIFPKPFSRIVVAFGEPIKVTKDITESDLGAQLQQLTADVCRRVKSDPSRWPA